MVALIVKRNRELGPDEASGSMLCSCPCIFLEPHLLQCTQQGRLGDDADRCCNASGPPSAWQEGVEKTQPRSQTELLQHYMDLQTVKGESQSRSACCREKGLLDRISGLIIDGKYWLTNRVYANKIDAADLHYEV